MDFPSGTAEDLTELIRAYPLAWLVTCGAAGFEATPLPLIAETDEHGAITALVGHCSRANAQTAALREDPRAYALFTGPQGYISPTHVSREHWAPTWNFAVAIFALEIELLEDGTEDAVRSLTNQVEAGEPKPWKIEQAGDRLGALMSRIIGFRGHVLASDVRMKLGQEEDLPTLREIIAGLQGGELADWMERLNHDRLKSADEDCAVGKHVSVPADKAG